jgi:hypothetical protein
VVYLEVFHKIRRFLWISSALVVRPFVSVARLVLSS